MYILIAILAQILILILFSITIKSISSGTIEIEFDEDDFQSWKLIAKQDLDILTNKKWIIFAIRKKYTSSNEDYLKGE